MYSSHGEDIHLLKEGQGFDPKDDEAHPSTASEAFASLLKWVGDFNRWQFKLVAKAGLVGAFTPLHNYGAIFLAATPDHWCRIPSLDVDGSVAKQLRNLTTPWIHSKTGGLELSKCQYYQHDYSEIKSKDQISDFISSDGAKDPVQCSSWYYDMESYGQTIVSEWDLVCDRKWLMSATQATYMGGILLGALIFSAISDRLGRRPASLMACVLFILSSFLVTFSTSLKMFLALRMATAAAGQGMYLVNYVLTMECSGQVARTWLSNLYGLYFTFGSSLLPILAYHLKDWRQLQLMTSLPTNILLLYFWMLPESPRWLCMNGRMEEGLAVLKEVARENNRSLPPQKKLNALVKVIEKEEKTESSAAKNVKPRNSYFGCSGFFQNLNILFGTRNMRRRMSIACFGWLVGSMVVYGLLFNGNNINVSIYKMVFYNNFSHFPIVFLSIYLLNKYGRRKTLLMTMIGGGFACLAVMFVPYEPVWINFLLTMLGRTLVGMAFGVLFIYTTELTPTHVRNISIGVASMFGRIGSIICPFIVDFLGEIYYAIPSALFGMLALASGFFSLALPETGFRRLPESIEEVESMPR